MVDTTTPDAPSAKRRGPALLIGIVVGVLALFAVVYLVAFRGSSKDELTLDEPSRGRSTIAEPAGRWTVASGSETCYRVREKLARLPAQSDAVGCTPDVTGSMQVAEQGDGYVVTDLSIEAGLQTLKSDSDRRDNRIRTHGLESDRFPKATFTAAGPIEVPDGIADGQKVKTDVAGSFTLHGVTKEVTIPVEAQLDGDVVQVVGSYHFQMAEYQITPPSIAGTVTVEPDATMELKLQLQKA